MASPLTILCFALLPISILLVNASFPLLRLLSGVTQTQLSIAPNRLRYDHLLLVIVLLIAKPFLRFLGLVPPLRSLTQAGGEQGIHSKDLAQSYELPLLSITMPLSLGWADVKQYQDAVVGVNNPKRKMISTTPLLILAGVTTPLMSLLLAKRTCPILPLGSVNIRNRFEFLEPERCREAVLGELRIAKASAHMQPKGRRVKRGFESDIVVEIMSGTGTGAQSSVIFRQIITILQFLKGPVEPRFAEMYDKKKIDEKLDQFFNDAAKTDLFFEYDAPTRWARVCKDYNPIHMSSIAAKLFGFKGKIAHGNLVVARAMEELSSRDGVLRDMWITQSRASWLEVHFKRPVVLPKDLELQSSLKTSVNFIAASFRVVSDSKTFMEGFAGWV